MSLIEERGQGIPAPLIAGISFLNRKIRSKRDIEKVSRFYIIGTVPHVGGSPGEGAGALCEELQEPFQQISNNLLFFFNKSGQKVIGIHSAKESEGKTFVSESLARCLALNGKKVLLVGANLRRPEKNRKGGAAKEAGLSSFLSGRPFEQCVRKAGSAGLWIMPEGPAVTDPVGLLSSDMFRELISRSREEFDSVILDNAPAAVGTDGIVTGAECDLNLFVLRARRSRISEIRYIHHLAGHGVIRDVALLLNDTI